MHDTRGRWFRMKNVTLSADEDLIDRARLIARGQRRTLNEAFGNGLLNSLRARETPKASTR